MSRLRMVSLAAAIGLVALPALAQSAVKLVSNGKTHTLKHMKAVRYVPNDGNAEMMLLFASSDPKEVVLADALGEDSFAVGRWAEASNSPAVMVKFKENEAANFSLNVYSDGQMVALGGHASGGETVGPFKTINVTDKAANGEVMYSAADRIITGTFKGAVATIREATAIKGAKVASSPQAAALLSFGKAMAKNDLKSAAAQADGDFEKSMAEAKEAFGEELFKEFVAEAFGNPKDLEKQLKSPETMLLEDGDRSEIRLITKTSSGEGSSTSTKTFRFAKVDGKWKIRVGQM
jgi:hypothetical protein